MERSGLAPSCRSLVTARWPWKEQRRLIIVVNFSFFKKMIDRQLASVCEWDTRRPTYTLKKTCVRPLGQNACAHRVGMGVTGRDRGHVREKFRDFNLKFGLSVTRTECVVSFKFSLVYQ